MPANLPNLLIAGVTKAATTSLFSYLAQHPDICGGAIKEPEYFSRLVYPGAELEPITTYERHFSHCGGRRYILEASPNYWYGGERLIESTERYLHNPRYVVSLRNPVDRLWSEFTYMKSKVGPPKDMTAESYVDRCLDLWPTHGEFSEQFRRFRSLSTGVYIDHLPLWHEAVGERFTVVFFEHLVVNAEAVVRGLLSWLDLEDGVAAAFDYSEQNPTIGHRSAFMQTAAYGVARRADSVIRQFPAVKGRLVRTYYVVNRAGPRDTVLDPAVRRRLEEWYEPHNRRLAAHLRSCGYRRLPNWLAKLPD